MLIYIIRLNKHIPGGLLGLSPATTGEVLFDVWVGLSGVVGGEFVSFFSITMVLCSFEDENWGSLLLLLNGSGASLIA